MLACVNKHTRAARQWFNDQRMTPVALIQTPDATQEQFSGQSHPAENTTHTADLFLHFYWITSAATRTHVCIYVLYMNSCKERKSLPGSHLNLQLFEHYTRVIYICASYEVLEAHELHKSTDVFLICVWLLNRKLRQSFQLVCVSNSY